MMYQSDAQFDINKQQLSYRFAFAFAILERLKQKKARDEGLRNEAELKTLRVVNMEDISLSMPVSDPFRFIDLPENVRRKIYTLLLCTVEDPLENEIDSNGCTIIPLRITKLQHDIHPQILRTCQKINHEATFTMRATNLLVMVTGLIRLDEPRNCFISRCIPMIRVKNETQAKDFRNSCIMTHEIKDPGCVFPDEPYRFMLLHRHLPRLCAALVVSAIGTVPYRDEISVQHIVTILGLHGEDIFETYSLFPLELQEKLVAPYRSEFSGFSGFRLEGRIQADLKNAVILGITQGPQLINHEAVIHKLEYLKARADDHLTQGDHSKANRICCHALIICRRILTIRKQQLSLSVGRSEFMNQIMDIYFSFLSSRAQHIINAMRTSGSQQGKVLLRFFLRIIDDPKNIQDQCNLSKWAPPQQELAIFRYREAVGCRLAGNNKEAPTQVKRAERAIKSALVAMPSHPEILAEKKRLREWATN
ncbi:hypothetical protein EYC80_010292 [Monilinia laxa]|uniref:Uncharacterized protein n=1 Tax=Monilinia laxa TaxID=61186 RepID=A0A5N6JNA4_MONLA|nr:hypothetical protein EYC80_010292 [Monilinia laxa]